MNTPIKEFNAIKSLLVAKGNLFSKKEFIGMLRTINGMPKYPNLFSCMQPDIIYKVAHGNRRKSEPALYSFKDTAPVYYRVLEHAIDHCIKTTKQYKKTHYKNKMEAEEITVVEILDPVSEIQKAIDLLKSHGYKILKPQYTEV